MINALNPVGNGIDPTDSQTQLLAAAQVAQATHSEKAQQEFMTLFYKEMLKQAFKPEDLNGDEEPQENSFISDFKSDIMVEQLANEMVKNGALRPNWLAERKVSE